MAAGDYFSAHQLLESIKTLIAGAESDLAAERVVQQSEQQQVHNIEWTRWLTIAAVAVIVLVLAYLLLPLRGYSPRTGSYSFKSPTERGKETVSDLKDKIETFGNKLPGMPKRSFAPAKLQPQPQQMQQQSYQPDVFQPKSVGYSFKPKPRIPVTGRFVAQPQTLNAVKAGFVEGITQKLSAVKDAFKPKKKEEYEVELSE
jgi:hypothetical protein